MELRGTFRNGELNNKHILNAAAQSFLYIGGSGGGQGEEGGDRLEDDNKNTKEE